MFIVNRKNDHLTEKGFSIIKNFISNLKSRRE
jgi:hypothetical protein